MKPKKRPTGLRQKAKKPSRLPLQEQIDHIDKVWRLSNANRCGEIDELFKRLRALENQPPPAPQPATPPAPEAPLATSLPPDAPASTEMPRRCNHLMYRFGTGTTHQCTKAINHGNLHWSGFEEWKSGDPQDRTAKVLG